MNSKENLLENLGSNSLLNSFIREFPYKNDTLINTEEDENSIFMNVPKRNRFNSFDNNLDEEKRNKFFDLNFFEDSENEKKKKKYIIKSLKKKIFNFSNMKNDFEEEKENKEILDLKENSIISEEIFPTCKERSKIFKKDLKELKKTIFGEKIGHNKLRKRKYSLKNEDYQGIKLNLLSNKISKIGNYWKNKSFSIPNTFKLIIKNESNVFDEILDYSKKEILIQDSQNGKKNEKKNLDFIPKKVN